MALGALALVVAAAVLGVVALLGAGVVRWVVLPRSVVLARPVHLDYRQAAPSAEVPFVASAEHLRGGELLEGAPGDLRVLRPGQKFDVVVGLRVPPGEANRDVFQVTGRLLTSDRVAVFEATRPAMVRQRGGLTGFAREAARVPWVLLGFASEDELIEITLVEGLEEDRLRPMALLGLEVARRGADPPQIVDIEARVVLQLHWAVKAMYNYPLWSFLTTALVVYCVLVSSAAVAGLALGLFWLVARSEEGGWATGPGEEPAVRGGKGEEAERELDLSSLAQEETLHFVPSDEDEGVPLQDLLLQAREEAAAALTERERGAAAMGTPGGEEAFLADQPPPPEEPEEVQLGGGEVAPGGRALFEAGGGAGAGAELRNRRPGRPGSPEG